jgi:hypothetical protein
MTVGVMAGPNRSSIIVLFYKLGSVQFRKKRDVAALAEQCHYLSAYWYLQETCLSSGKNDYKEKCEERGQPCVAQA